MQGTGQRVKELLEELRVELDVIELSFQYKMQAIRMEAKCEMKVIMEKYI